MGAHKDNHKASSTDDDDDGDGGDATLTPIHPPPLINKKNNNMKTTTTTTTTLIFTYGTLKHGFSNHSLLQDMMATHDAAYLGLCRTAHKLPLVCGPYRVPFLLNFQDLGDHVFGELYAVSPSALSRMDELEGLTRGHYERLPIKVKKDDDLVTPAEAYYAHRSYADALWKRNGEKGYNCYSHQEAKGYVKRKDRPQHLSFLDHIQLFLSSSSDVDHHPPPQ